MELAGQGKGARIGGWCARDWLKFCRYSLVTGRDGNLCMEFVHGLSP